MSTNHNWYCLVCREIMSSHEVDDEDLIDESMELRVLVATSCGHLFHNACLEKSCDSKRVHQHELGLPVQEQDYCPSCDREIEMTNCRRIYPTELPEDLGLENLTIGNEQELRQKIEELTAEVHRLKAQTNIQKEVLKKTTTAPASTSSRASATVYGRGHIRAGPTAPTATQRDFLEVQEKLEACGFRVNIVSPGVAIKQDDAVVWFTDENPSGDAGIVRWIGTVGNSGTVYAGIQFDNPSGNQFRNAPPDRVILFQASSGNTGWLVRISELMMYKDFHGHDYYPPGPEDFQLLQDYEDDYEDDD